MNSPLFTSLNQVAHHQAGDISQELVNACLHSDQPDALGLAYDLITDRVASGRITPLLSYKEAHALVRMYYYKCIVHNFDDEWADSRLSAVMDCKNWLSATWAGIDEHERSIWFFWAKELVQVDLDVSKSILMLIKKLSGTS